MFISGVLQGYNICKHVCHMFLHFYMSVDVTYVIYICMIHIYMCVPYEYSLCGPCVYVGKYVVFVRTYVYV